MKDILKKGIIIISIYSVFTAYLLFACERFSRLEEDEESFSSVVVKVGD